MQKRFKATIKTMQRKMKMHKIIKVSCSEERAGAASSSSSAKVRGLQEVVGVRSGCEVTLTSSTRSIIKITFIMNIMKNIITF